MGDLNCAGNDPPQIFPEFHCLSQPIKQVLMAPPQTVMVCVGVHMCYVFPTIDKGADCYSIATQHLAIQWNCETMQTAVNAFRSWAGLGY